MSTWNLIKEWMRSKTTEDGMLLKKLFATLPGKPANMLCLPSTQNCDKYSIPASSPCLSAFLIEYLPYLIYNIVCACSRWWVFMLQALKIGSGLGSQGMSLSKEEKTLKVALPEAVLNFILPCYIPLAPRGITLLVPRLLYSFCKSFCMAHPWFSKVLLSWFFKANYQSHCCPQPWIRPHIPNSFI